VVQEQVGGTLHSVVKGLPVGTWEGVIFSVGSLLFVPPTRGV